MSKKRCQHSPDLKAKVGLEALKGIEPVRCHRSTRNCPPLKPMKIFIKLVFISGLLVDFAHAAESKDKDSVQRFVGTIEFLTAISPPPHKQGEDYPIYFAQVTITSKNYTGHELHFPIFKSDADAVTRSRIRSGDEISFKATPSYILGNEGRGKLRLKDFTELKIEKHAERPAGKAPTAKSSTGHSSVP